MPININRPNSALLRGVNITEFKGHIINPDPIILQETDFLLEEFLSPTKLKALTGVNDLRSVDNLEMIVDTSETSLGNFGIYLPNLKQLKLNGSHVPRIRDLGTSLANLRVLWLSRSGLSDLDGIPTLNNLEELYLAYNEVNDLSSLSLLENLRCLDLEGNLIDDIKQVEFLDLCSKLTNLTLYGNPICVKPTPDANENNDYSYRHEIIKALPNLQILDDELTLNTKPLSAAGSSSTEKSHRKSQQNDLYKQECPFDDDWTLINQLIDEGIGPPEEKLAINESIRPSTSSSNGSRTNTSVRPLSVMRPLSSYRIKTSFSQQRPSSRLNSSNSLESGSRVSTANQQRPNSDPVFDIANDASNLTVGPTIQGNPFRSLLARKKPIKPPSSPPTPQEDNHKSSTQLNTISSSTKENYNSAMKSLKNVNIKDEKNYSKNIEIENENLRAEILRWKSDHAKKLEERKEYFQPQVLKIDDTYEKPLSDDELNDPYYDETYNNMIEVTDDLESLKSSSRPKSSFKQNFDYNKKSNINNLIISDATADDNISKKEKKSSSEEKSKRARSSDKKKRREGSGKTSRSSSRSKTSHERSSGASSRLATGDTGFDSLSNLSLSSSFNNNNEANNLRESSTNGIRNKHHQPIIIQSSASSSISSSSNLISNSIKPITQHQPALGSSSSLKQLKTNLLPLSGIKLPK